MSLDESFSGCPLPAPVQASVQASDAEIGADVHQRYAELIAEGASPETIALVALEKGAQVASSNFAFFARAELAYSHLRLGDPLQAERLLARAIGTEVAARLRVDAAMHPRAQATVMVAEGAKQPTEAGSVDEALEAIDTACTDESDSLDALIAIQSLTEQARAALAVERTDVAATCLEARDLLDRQRADCQRAYEAVRACQRTRLEPEPDDLVLATGLDVARQCLARCLGEVES